MPGFYPKAQPSKFIHLMEKDVIKPLEAQGLLVSYGPADACWEKVTSLIAQSAKRRGTKMPRGLSKAYQSHFLYLQDPTHLPIVHGLCTPSKEMNVDLVALLNRFPKPEEYTWRMLNLLICARTDKARNALRIHLYRLPLDYDAADLLDSVLDYGCEFKTCRFPFQPDFEEAKRFLDSLAGQGGD
ncbi:MAG: hypothetical protein DRP08_07960 [Candidatus Aenigmatarchaeota archaeon]|nr:MAG: hypothetical protein DRP08_07960 [Candidatus Aenigmarchaeota archaeon]